MDTMKDLTERQEKVLKYLEQYYRENGYPPTIREVGDSFEITAKGAYDHIHALEKKGYIRCHKNRSRAIEFMKASSDASKQAKLQVSNMVNIPLVGNVAAGAPIVAEENIEEYISFPRSMLPQSQGLFALRVRGDSMKDASILDGDIAIIKKQEIADNGDIVVALIDDEATLKYYYKESDKKVRLEPANKNYKPIYTSNLVLLGKLVGMYRTMQ